eukprot:15478535-Alexandrium_andersonii.AAC.1
MDEGLHGGMRGRSAATANYEFAAQLEQARLLEQSASALFIDMHKCFDQVSRELIWTLADHYGAPRGVLNAWLAAVDNFE